MKIMSLLGKGINEKIFLDELNLLQKQGDNDLIVKYFDHFQPDTRLDNCYIIIEYFQVRQFYFHVHRPLSL